MTKTKLPKILFIDILTDNKKAKQRIEKTIYGGKTYAEHMRKMFGLQKSQFVTVDGAFEKLPNPNDFDAIVLGGSRHNPVAGEEWPWIKNIYKYLQVATKKDIPILGICGGLQFTVRAMGEDVVYNPKGREFGSFKISLSKDGARDPIFKGLSKNIMAQLSHRCMAKKLKRGWKLLAFSKICPIQAIAIGPNIRLVQFHPEMTSQQLKNLARMRKESFFNEGLVKDDKEFVALLRSISNTEKVGKKILKNFITYFVLPYHAKRGIV